MKTTMNKKATIKSLSYGKRNYFAACSESILKKYIKKYLIPIELNRSAVELHEWTNLTNACLLYHN